MASVYARKQVPTNKKGLADKIHDRRLQLGLTQEQASEAAGVSSETWRQYESGRSPNSPQRRVLTGIDAALGWQPGTCLHTLTTPPDEETAMPAKNTDHIDVRYLVVPQYTDDEHYQVVNVQREVTTYPVTKAGHVQWGQGGREVEVIIENLPTRHIARLIEALVDSLAYTATGECKADAS